MGRAVLCRLPGRRCGQGQTPLRALVRRGGRRCRTVLTPAVGHASYSPSGSDQAGCAKAVSNGITGRGHTPVTTQVSTGADTGPWTGRVNASTSALSHDDINPGYRRGAYPEWKRLAALQLIRRPLRARRPTEFCLSGPPIVAGDPLRARPRPPLRCGPTGSGQPPTNVRCAHPGPAPPGPLHSTALYRPKSPVPEGKKNGRETPR